MPVELITKEIEELSEEKKQEVLHFVLFLKSGYQDSPFRPKSEQELLERIDRGVEQANEGLLQDADEAIDEIIAELNA